MTSPSVNSLVRRISAVSTVAALVLLSGCSSGLAPEVERSLSDDRSFTDDCPVLSTTELVSTWQAADMPLVDLSFGEGTEGGFQYSEQGRVRKIDSTQCIWATAGDRKTIPVIIDVVRGGEKEVQIAANGPQLRGLVPQTTVTGVPGSGDTWSATPVSGGVTLLVIGPTASPESYRELGEALAVTMRAD
jgi:hypothetical protein